MSNRKELGSISYHTDDDTGMYQIGEIDGGWYVDLLDDYVRAYGVSGLLNQLAYMTASVIESQRKVNAEKFQAYNEAQTYEQ